MSHPRVLWWQQRHTLARATWALTWTLWLCGCAGVPGVPGVSVNSRWQDGAARNQTFSRVLVVGVSPDFDLRCNFEYAFATQLRSPSTKVFPSCDSMTPKEPLIRANIERVVASVQADVVIATRLVSATAAKGEGGTWDTRGDSQYKATDLGWAYGVPVTEVEIKTAAPLTNFTSSVRVATTVYDARDGRVLYTLDTQTKGQDFDSSGATLALITASTADRLRRDGLIR